MSEYIEIPFLGSFNEQRLRAKTQESLHSLGITVEIEGSVPEGGLVVANHPTDIDSVFWRTVPDAFHLVHAEALSKTGISSVDRKIALHLSHMIPVYAESSEARAQTYRDAAAAIRYGKLVVINPEGRTSWSNDVASVQQLKVGGIVRILEYAQLDYFIPAWVDVNRELSATQQLNGATVRLRFGEPVGFSGDVRDQGENISHLVVNAWRELR